MTHSAGSQPAGVPEPVEGHAAVPEGPHTGDRAPDFALSDQHGQVVSRADLAGQPFLLVFYPYAFSGICSSELKQLQTALDEFSAAGVRLLAVSVDTMFAVRTFADQLGLTFPLLSDFWPHGAVARKYGVFDAERGCALRGSFLVDADGVIDWSVRNEIGTARDVAEHLRAATDIGQRRS